ncbi:hypothetical protein K1T71_007881 [Dendrolimus kikuchii]|uniref:Uncharacterized protein n=1 Tax=Dendrolimus kikuchii TaxID=765133 RepID=A0ACC1CYN4_9NEOP|nr:hypothetical protein K1T71_007881 [Dendrolimus kikuchii]
MGRPTKGAVLKMKYAFVVLLLGFVGVIANPVSNQITDNEKSALKENDSIGHNESTIKQNEDILNKAKPEEQEQKEVTIETLTPESLSEGTNNGDASLEFVIQENVVSPFEQFGPLPELSPQDDFDNFQGLPVSEDIDKFSLMKMQDEIMETAAGFAPLPFLRRRQKPRKHFASRRNYNKNPHRRFQFFYPYYYAFYRPSSLRFD